MRLRQAAWLTLCAIGLARVGAAQAPVPASGPWAIPPEGTCQPADGLKGPLGADAPPVPFQKGDTFDITRMPVLEDYLPRALWEHRERFFYEGMRLEIGDCFRDYSPPGFFQEATERFRGQASLNDAGGLEGFRAGLPFAPEDIAADDPQAGLKWAWNTEHRYQAGGFLGRFRMTDLVGQVGRAEPFEGEIFKYILSFRSDRAQDDYEHPAARGNQWVVGGLYFKPFAAREYSWRQYRNVEHLTSRRRSDDLHAYLPEWRRVRRISGANVEGIYMPSFSVGVVPAQQLVVGAGGGTAGAGGVAAAGGAGDVGGSITPKRSGFEGLEMRPLLYSFRVVGLHDVLSPLNAVTPSYPENPDRGTLVRERSLGSAAGSGAGGLVREGRRRGRSGGALPDVRRPPDAPAALLHVLRQPGGTHRRGLLRGSLERGPAGLSALAGRSGPPRARDRLRGCGVREPLPTR